MRLTQPRCQLMRKPNKSAPRAAPRAPLQTCIATNQYQSASWAAVIASGQYRRRRYCSRTMIRGGLKPKPTLSRRAGEGVSSPRPFGERGGGEGQAVLKTSNGQTGFMEYGQHRRGCRPLAMTYLTNSGDIQRGNARKISGAMMIKINTANIGINIIITSFITLINRTFAIAHDINKHKP